MLYNIIQHFHSGWAYLTLFMGVMFFIILGFYILNKRERDGFIKKASFFTVLIFHIQLITGAILYFISPRVESGETFYALEHPIMMFTAVLLITVASSKLKKDKVIKPVTLILTAVALICLFVMIPWADWSK